MQGITERFVVFPYAARIFLNVRRRKGCQGEPLRDAAKVFLHPHCVV